MNIKKIFRVDKEKYSVTRIESLSDGVFSITMTLLILSVKVPPLSPDDSTTINKLLQILPILENYFISFIVLGLFWMRHQMQFKEIRVADRNLMWINIFFLMFVAIIPFTTSMMVEYSNNHISIQVYCFNLILLGLILILHWEYGIHNHRLIDDNLNMKEMRFVTKIQLVTPSIFFISGMIAFVDIKLAKMSLYMLPLISAALIKTYRKVRKPAAT